MKTLIKKMMPVWLLKWYKMIRAFKFTNKSVKDVFTEIYNTNHWKSLESISGTGSEISQTVVLVEGLETWLKSADIRSILDIPCGDFKWMKKVNLSKINYIGADIVEDLIKDNLEKYQDNNITFKVLNLINDPLPNSDVIIVRDCLVHMSYENIFNAIKNIKLSGSKFLLTTTFVDYCSNYDIVTGDWRRLNLQKKPFNFPKPILIINEQCTEDNGIYRDKSMALWEIEKI